MSVNTLFEKIKTDFNVNANLSDVKLKNVTIEPYPSIEKDHRFGEKECLLYNISLEIFNIDISIKILSFLYDKHAEILKLDININNNLLSQEMCSCKNFLQRKRNLNSTFELIIKHCELFEIRRIISHCIFQKIPTIQSENDVGLYVRCNGLHSNDFLLDFHWRIVWNIDDNTVADFIEFYANYSVISKYKKHKIKEKLNSIVNDKLDFHKKFKLWRKLMEDLYGSEVSNFFNNNNPKEKTEIYEISDSESDESVIEINSTSQNSDEILILE